MTALAIIAEVGKLISEPTRWCQGHMAVNAKGQPCSPLRARRLDPIGATYAVTRIKLADDHVNRHTNDHAAALAILQGCALRLHRMSLEQVNDRLGHEAVMEVVREAYRYAKWVPPKD